MNVTTLYGKKVVFFIQRVFYNHASFKYFASAEYKAKNTFSEVGLTVLSPSNTDGNGTLQVAALNKIVTSV